MSSEAKFQILLVDDEDEIRIAVSRFLVSRDFEVATAASAALACEQWARGFRPDVIVTDFKMPRMNGLELIDWFRAQGSSAEAVLISGNLSDVPAARVQGITVLPKPFRLSDLLKAVRGAKLRPPG